MNSGTAPLHNIAKEATTIYASQLSSLGKREQYIGISYHSKDMGSSGVRISN